MPKRKKQKPPPGCYWRGQWLWGRVRKAGGPKGGFKFSLRTGDPAVARERFETEKKRLIADMHFGDAPRTFDDAIVGWETWIARRVRPKAVKRYACSLGQLAPWLERRRLPEINGRLIAEIVRDRTAAGVTNATIKRDLVAVSSVMNYAIDQGWVESNPVLDRMKRVKETRRTVVLPRPEDIALVVSRAPGMIKHLVAVAIATGAREEELLKVTRDDVDAKHARMTLVGKRGKRRTIDLNPFNGVQIIQSLPAYMGKILLFWHSAGEDYKNFSSQFRDIVRRTDDWAEASKVDFRPFRFHDLRHLHAIEWLRSGRSILELQHRLGHASIKTTEEYLKAGYLTYEQQGACKAALPGSGPAAMVSSKVTA
jgi:integrase/recombinase XerD